MIKRICIILLLGFSIFAGIRLVWQENPPQDQIVIYTVYHKTNLNNDFTNFAIVARSNWSTNYYQLPFDTNIGEHYFSVTGFTNIKTNL